MIRNVGLGAPIGLNVPMGPNVNLNPNFSPLAVNLPLAPGSVGNGGAGANNTPAPLTQIQNAQSPFTPFVAPNYAFAVTEPAQQAVQWWMPLAFLGGLAALFFVSTKVLGKKGSKS